MVIYFAEKFDDIKFGKVLTKLYARLFSMEGQKFMPPKFSNALKDLTTYMGIFEKTEDDHKHKSEASDTSSQVTSVFRGSHQLEVVHENNGSGSDESGDDKPTMKEYLHESLYIKKKKPAATHTEYGLESRE